MYTVDRHISAWIKQPLDPMVIILTCHIDKHHSPNLHITRHHLWDDDWQHQHQPTHTPTGPFLNHLAAKKGLPLGNLTDKTGVSPNHVRQEGLPLSHLAVEKVFLSANWQRKQSVLSAKTGVLSQGSSYIRIP